MCASKCPACRPLAYLEPLHRSKISAHYTTSLSTSSFPLTHNLTPLAPYVPLLSLTLAHLTNLQANPKLLSSLPLWSPLIIPCVLTSPPFCLICSHTTFPSTFFICLNLLLKCQHLYLSLFYPIYSFSTQFV